MAAGGVTIAANVVLVTEQPADPGAGGDALLTAGDDAPGQELGVEFGTGGQEVHALAAFCSRRAVRDSAVACSATAKSASLP